MWKNCFLNRQRQNTVIDLWYKGYWSQRGQQWLITSNAPRVCCPFNQPTSHPRKQLFKKAGRQRWAVKQRKTALNCTSEHRLSCWQYEVKSHPQGLVRQAGTELMKYFSSAATRSHRPCCRRRAVISTHFMLQLLKNIATVCSEAQNAKEKTHFHKSRILTV